MSSASHRSRRMANEIETTVIAGCVCGSSPRATASAKAHRNKATARFSSSESCCDRKSPNRILESSPGRLGQRGRPTARRAERFPGKLAQYKILWSFALFCTTDEVEAIRKLNKRMAPQVGLEPTTLRLTAVRVANLNAVSSVACRGVHPNPALPLGYVLG